MGEVEAIYDHIDEEFPVVISNPGKWERRGAWIGRVIDSIIEVFEEGKDDE